MTDREGPLSGRPAHRILITRRQDATTSWLPARQAAGRCRTTEDAGAPEAPKIGHAGCFGPYCPGAAVDTVVDMRVGSPTYGQWEAVEVDARSFLSMYSARDQVAPTLAEAERQGLLPRYEVCLAMEAALWR